MSWQQSLIPDLNNIVYNYLSLEELISSTNNNPTLQDTLVNKFYPRLPSVQQSIRYDNINTVKYLIEHKINDGEDELNNFIDVSIQFDNLNILKYLLSTGRKADGINLEKALEHNSKVCLNYLLSIDIFLGPSDSSLSDQKGNLDKYKFIIAYVNQNSLTTEEFKTVTKYIDTLLEMKIYPDNNALVYGISIYDNLPHRTILMKIIDNIQDLDINLLIELRDKIQQIKEDDYIDDDRKVIELIGIHLVKLLKLNSFENE